MGVTLVEILGRWGICFFHVLVLNSAPVSRFLFRVGFEDAPDIPRINLLFEYAKKP